MALPLKKAAPAAKAAAPAKPKAEKAKKPGVGEFVKAQILAGKDNDKILELVAAKFPEAKTSSASINWYRSALRQAGETVPTTRKPKAEKPAKPAATKAPAKAVATKAPAKTAAKPTVAKKSAPAKASKADDSEGGF